MKYIIMIAALTCSAALVNGQTNSGVAGSGQNMAAGRSARTNSAPAAKGVKHSRKKLPAGTAIHGGKVVSLYHGKHDYTPGSPVGTGGAGGGTMSGSQQGSASENALGRKSSNELLKNNNNQNKKNSQQGNTNKQ